MTPTDQSRPKEVCEKCGAKRLLLGGGILGTMGEIKLYCPRCELFALYGLSHTTPTDQSKQDRGTVESTEPVDVEKLIERVNGLLMGTTDDHYLRAAAGVRTDILTLAKERGAAVAHLNIALRHTICCCDEVEAAWRFVGVDEPETDCGKHDLVKRAEKAEAGQHDAERELEELKVKYYELIMVVSTKYPNETRHQTALRQLQESEHRGDNQAKQEATDGDRQTD